MAFDETMDSKKSDVHKRKRGNPNWIKGQTGNNKGRPLGSTYEGTKLAKQLFQDNAKDIANKCLEMAKAGDVTCIKLCLDRISPALRDVPRDEEGRVQPLILNIDHEALASLTDGKPDKDKIEVRPIEPLKVASASSK
jgi:hypothetical protein